MVIILFCLFFIQLFSHEQIRGSQANCAVLAHYIPAMPMGSLFVGLLIFVDIDVAQGYIEFSLVDIFGENKETPVVLW